MFQWDSNSSPWKRHWCVSTIYHATFHSQTQKVHSPNLLKETCIREVVRIVSIIIFRLSKLWKAKFFILCGVTFLVRLQGKFEIDHSWEWKGEALARRDASILYQLLHPVWPGLNPDGQVHFISRGCHVRDLKPRESAQKSRLWVGAR